LPSEARRSDSRTWVLRGVWVLLQLATGVNPAGDAGDTSPQYFCWGDVNGNIPQYYYVLSDTADQYWLPSFRSASSRFHSVIRRHQFASVRQADSRLTRLNLELALTPLQLALTPPASGSRAALRPSPAGSGAVAVERFTYILIFPGSLLCHIIKGKQLQKSLNLTAKRLCQPPWWAEKNYINRGSYQQQHGS